MKRLELIEKEPVNGIIEVGFPFMPSNWGKTMDDKSPKEECISVSEVAKITMTCGGGMGGAQWCEYIPKSQVKNLPEQGFITVIDIDGNEKILSVRYIVKVEFFTMYNLQFFSAHENHYGLNNRRFLVSLSNKRPQIQLLDLYTYDFWK